MTDGVTLSVIPPNVHRRSEMRDTDDGPIPLLGKNSGESAGQVDTREYPDVDVHVTVDTGSDVERFDERYFSLHEEGDSKEIKRFDFRGDALDLVFVFDDTASMSQEIDEAKRGVTDLTDGIATQDIDARYALVSFKDDVEVDRRFTDNPGHLKSAVDDLEARAGGDVPEANFDAIERALDLNFRSDAQKVFVDITDAPSHYRGDGSGYSDYTFDEVAGHLENAGVTFISVGPDTENRTSSLKSLAGEVGGFWTDVAPLRRGSRENFETVLERITSLVASTYVIGFHTCTPPGTNRSLSVEFDHPDYGSDTARTVISVPSRFDLPPECEDAVAGEVTTRTSSVEKDADSVTRSTSRVEKGASGVEKDDTGAEKESPRPSTIFVDADRYRLAAGDNVTVTVRDAENNRVSGATVECGSEVGTTSDRGVATLTLSEPGEATIRATHNSTDDTSSVTVTVDPRNDDSDRTTITKSEEGGQLVLEPEYWSVESRTSMTFTVKNLNKTRIEDAVVETNEDRAETGPRGTCELMIGGPGTVTVTARTPDEPYAPDEIEIDTH